MSMRLLARLTPAGKGKFISARTFAAPVRPGGLCHLPLPFPPAYSFCVRRRQNGRKLFRTESEPFCAKSRSRNCGFKTGVCARAPARVCVCVCVFSQRARNSKAIAIRDGEECGKRYGTAQPPPYMPSVGSGAGVLCAIFEAIFNWGDSC